jgi:hypothetical protein
MQKIVTDLSAHTYVKLMFKVVYQMALLLMHMIILLFRLVMQRLVWCIEAYVAIMSRQEPVLS